MECTIERDGVRLLATPRRPPVRGHDITQLRGSCAPCASKCRRWRLATQIAGIVGVAQCGLCGLAPSGVPAASGRKHTMSKEYEIHSGRRIVSTQFSVSALQAVVDYVRSYGVKDDEIRRLGVDC